MGYYDLSKEERQNFVKKMEDELTSDLQRNKMDNILQYSSDDDVYIGKMFQIFWEGFIVIRKPGPKNYPMKPRTSIKMK